MASPYLTISRPLSDPQSNASRIARGVIPFNRSARTYRGRAGEIMIRSPSASTSTRAPSRRPARSAISLGMRRPRLLPQRATCTCIGLSVSIWDIRRISDIRRQASGPMPFSFMPPKGRSLQRAFGRDDALVDADDAVFERLGDTRGAADVAAVEIGGE